MGPSLRWILRRLQVRLQTVVAHSLHPNPSGVHWQVTLAAGRGDTTRVAKLHARVMQIHRTIYGAADHGAAVIAGLKCALRCLEICNDLMADPFPRLDDAQRQLIRKHVAELGLRDDALAEGT